MIYESRLELSRLLFADFDPSVRGIVAQPFLLKTVLEGKVRQHVPDYLLRTGQVPVVVDVKPLHRLSKPEVAFTFGWIREAVESRGWKYEVWSEPPAVELETSGSWRVTAETGCSAPKPWRSSGTRISTGSFWDRPRGVCRIIRSLTFAPPSIICSGGRISSLISAARWTLRTC